MNSNNAIIKYYDSCEIDYKLIWKLNKHGAMHFGLWDDRVRTFSQALIRENEVLAQIAKITKEDYVLDAGCGVGGSSVFLAKKIGCKVVGITLSEKQISSAKEFARKNDAADLVNFQIADFTKTNFEHGTFDVIWAIESVCHAYNKEDFVKEAARILKKGGRLIIADWFASKEDFSEKEKVLMKKWLNGWAVNSLDTQERFWEYLEKSNFKNIKFCDVTQNIMNSSKRLYLYSLPALFFGKLAEFLKIRNRIQTGNIIAAHYHHKALK